MSDLITRAQLEMLARLLETDVEDVRWLERLGAEGLKQLRTSISAYLFDADAETFKRVSKLAPLVPNAVVAKVAEAAVPPLVSGRLGGALGLDHTERAASLLKQMRPDYLADAAPHLDPRALAVLAPRFDSDPEALIPAATVLLARKDYATAAAFLDFATPALVEAFAFHLEDVEALVEAVSYVDSDEQLTRVISHVPEDRLTEIVLGALASERGTLAALSIGARLDPPLTARVGAPIVHEIDGDRLTNLIRSAIEGGAAKELVTVFARTDGGVERLLGNELAASHRDALTQAAGEAGVALDVQR